MKANVYNIIWADDDIDSLRRDPDNKEIMAEEDVFLLDFAHTSFELKEKLEEWGDQVDAIITDGNYDKSRLSGFKDSTTSGLTDTITILNDINRKRYVPAYLYTGKGKMLKDKFSDGELDFFEKKGRYFEKGKFSQMIKKIKEDVEHVNSSEFRIHNKYAKEFEAAKLIDDATENLQRGLLYIYEEDKWNNVQEYFNPARKIVERIFAKLKEQKILPPISSLNTMSKLLSKGKYEDSDCLFEFKTELMHPALAHSLQFLLDVTQDGSHDNGDLKLGVDSYIRQIKNSNLYRSILFIAMDLLLWYKDISKIEIHEEEIWTGSLKFEYVGKLCLSPDGRYWYSGEYELMGDPSFKDGAKVGIKKSIENKKAKPGIKKFVPKGCYTILEE